MSVTLITAKTAAETTTGLAIDGVLLPATLIASGLAGVESIPVKVSIDGSAYEPMVDFNTGLLVVLDVTHPQIAINNPVNIQLVKGVTGASVGVGLATRISA